MRSDSRWSTEVTVSRSLAGWCAAVISTGAVGVGHAAAQLSDGPGRSETVKLCSQCHAPEVVVSMRQDRAGWAATLRKMAALGAKGTPAEFSAALEYLATQFPAAELPRVNVNTATAIALESGLTLKRSQAAAIVAYRVAHGPFRSFEDLKTVPGLDVAMIEAKRERLTF
jgi:competence ComEA-like helix-hairpin-helix protein